MKSVRKRLTYANVMSSLALFLVLAGGTAFAAAKLGKNTVGSKQLKANAVTAAKIKNGAVTGGKLAAGAVAGSQLGAGSVNESKLADGAVGGAKLANGAVGSSKIAGGAVGGSQLADGAVTTSKIAGGAVTGAQINAPTTPFGQIVARIRVPGPYSFTGAAPGTPIGGYVQPAGEDDVYLAGADVNFPAACEAPRSATIYLTLDPVDPAKLTVGDLTGYGTVTDESGGALTKRLEIAPYPGGSAMARMATASATQHNFYVYLAGASCKTGSGVTASNFGVDVLGTK